MNNVSLPDMLNAREIRAAAQQQLLRQYRSPLICLTLNIPGPVKVFPGVAQAFQIGCQRIEAALSGQAFTILKTVTIKEHTGYEAFYCVDGDANEIKKRMIRLEDLDPLGRLFDIDVLKAAGEKISREDLDYPARRCLLCEEPAHSCSRSRRHSVPELLSHIETVLDNCEQLSQYVKKAISDALTAEVSTTPKPGLVDLHDSGAHQDMDYHTFKKSTEAITPYLLAMFQAGLNWISPSEATGLFSMIRRIGVEAEQAMFTATGGINTHKGMIFSMGTIAAAAGCYYQQHHVFSIGDILLLAGTLCEDAMRRDFEAIDPSAPKSHGESLYVRFGYTGIRGEAMAGFPSIRTISYPYLSAQMSKHRSQHNRIYLNTLFLLMAHTDDTNVLIRTGPQMLSYMQDTAKEFLKQDGAFGSGAEMRLQAMNEDFINKNISPGGCADLLAVTIFLWFLEQYPVL